MTEAVEKQDAAAAEEFRERIVATQGRHADATQLLLDSYPEPLAMHPVTMAELLVGAVRSDLAHELRADLVILGISAATLDDDHPMLLARLRAETGLKMPDCCVLATAEGHGAQIATFDRRLADTARDRGLVVREYGRLAQ